VARRILAIPTITFGGAITSWQPANRILFWVREGVENNVDLYRQALYARHRFALRKAKMVVIEPQVPKDSIWIQTARSSL
jgi:hypothetical protein